MVEKLDQISANMTHFVQHPAKPSHLILVSGPGDQSSSALSQQKLFAIHGLMSSSRFAIFIGKFGATASSNETAMELFHGTLPSSSTASATHFSKSLEASRSSPTLKTFAS